MYLGTGQHRPWQPGEPPAPQEPAPGRGPRGLPGRRHPATGWVGSSRLRPRSRAGRLCGRGTARPGAGWGFLGPTRKSNHGVNRGSTEHALKVRLSLFILPNENCGVSESKRQLFMTINKCRGDWLRPCGLGAGPGRAPRAAGAEPLFPGPPAPMHPLPRPTLNHATCRLAAGGGRGRCAGCCPGSFPRLGGQVRLPVLPALGRRAPQ